jgi:general stress protein 26
MDLEAQTSAMLYSTLHEENMQETTRDEAIAKLTEFIKDIRIAMLTTQTPEGSLRGRPMATQEAPFDGDLWFFTSAASPKVDEIEEEHHVQLSYASPEDNRYVSVSGRATVVRDRAKAEELWSPAMKAWFPDGLDDPDLALLRVQVEGAEYWDSPSSTMVHIVGLVKAVSTGQRYHPVKTKNSSFKGTFYGKRIDTGKQLMRD